VEALPESFGVRQDFSALVCLSAEALPESYGFHEESLLESLSCIRILACQDSHGFTMDLVNLPIIVSYPITSHVLFVHLHIV
jgi:hypothetical protein